MKKFVFVWLFAFVSVLCHALNLTEHLSFMGIPISADDAALVNILRRKCRVAQIVQIYNDYDYGKYNKRTIWFYSQ